MKTIDIPVESRLSIQIFEANTLPSLSREEIVSMLIQNHYCYHSHCQSAKDSEARGLEGKYLEQHLLFIDQAPRMPDSDAKKILIQLMYLNIGSRVLTDYLKAHWKI